MKTEATGRKSTVERLKGRHRAVRERKEERQFLLCALSLKWVESSPSYLTIIGRSSIIPFTLCVWDPSKCFDIIPFQFNITRAYSIPFLTDFD